MKDASFLLEILAVLCALSIGMQLIRRMRLHRLKTKSSSRIKVGQDFWVQVYDTDSMDEALQIRARLQEENLEVLIYEQGRKDVFGNVPKNYGLAVPRPSMSRAQNVILRMPA